MIKIISTDLENKTIEFDLYLTVPDGNNSVPSGNSAYPVTWADAIALSGKYETETIDTITYVKRREIFRFSSATLTNTQRLAELLAYHTTAKTKLQSDIAAELKFTGYIISD